MTSSNSMTNRTILQLRSWMCQIDTPYSIKNNNNKIIIKKNNFTDLVCCKYRVMSLICFFCGNEEIFQKKKKTSPHPKKKEEGNVTCSLKSKRVFTQSWTLSAKSMSLELSMPCCHHYGIQLMKHPLKHQIWLKFLSQNKPALLDARTCPTYPNPALIETWHCLHLTERENHQLFPY